MLLAVAIPMRVLAQLNGLCETREFYVSAQGNDSHAGTKERPFQTFEAARNAVRSSTGDGQITIWLRAGVYERQGPFELGVDDSGSDDRPIVYCAWPGEEVRITGGRQLSQWESLADDGICERLIPAARDYVVRTDLKAVGISDYGQIKEGGLELFFEDEPMMLARWPNQGFVTIVDLVEPDTLDVRGATGSQTGKLIYEGDRPRRWLDEKDIWVHGYWFWDWAEERQRVESIEVENRVVSIGPPYHVHGYRRGQWFYWFNIGAELDVPGEWYLDRQTGWLYFWPPISAQMGRAIVSTTTTLVTMRDVSHTTIQGVIFEACCGTAVTMEDCMHVKIAGCVLRNLGGRAVEVKGGLHNEVTGCDVYGTGDGGIELRGGDRPSLTPAHHVANNNHIYRYGRWNRTYTPAIALKGVGNRASHNVIHDAPHMAILFEGNDHTIEFNEIHDVCRESNDAGAIYAGRDWTMRGTSIRHNYLHNIRGREHLGCVGIYLDDMFCGTEVYGNVFYRVTRAAFIGGGRDCIVENNIFVECEPSLHIDARALGWAIGSVDTTMKPRLEAMPYLSDLWRERYPELARILEDEPAAPKGNIVVGNISWGGLWDEVSSAAQPYIVFMDNWVDRDPLFDGMPPETFLVRADSPVYRIGFKPIPFEYIGLYDDECRHQLPGR